MDPLGCTGCTGMYWDVMGCNAILLQYTIMPLGIKKEGPVNGIQRYTISCPIIYLLIVKGNSTSIL
jgi:hypothetical protein